MKWIGRRDAPDRLFIRNGSVVFVEFKAPGEKPRSSQEREHKLMLGYGCRVLVIDNFDDFQRAFQ